MRIAYLAALLLIMAAFFVGAYAYQIAGDYVPSHWNAAGEVDGRMDSFWGLFLMPLVMIPILALLVAIPRIDPLKKNYMKFRGYFEGFIIVIILFFLYMQLLITAAALGSSFNMTVAMVPAVSLLIFFAGIMMEKTKRNWFVGIKTPWTLSSDRVWDRTHRLGGKLFKAAAVVSMLGLPAGENAFWIMMAAIVVAAVCPVVYSYFEYQKLPRKK